MRIQLPKASTYYYECTDKATRLLLWLPPSELERMVRGRKAKKKILRDYPDGLDLKVSHDAFDEFNKVYGLVLGLHPDAIWDAFWAIWLNTDRRFRGSGYIRRRFLEGLARRIQRYMAEYETAIRVEPKRLREKRERKQALASRTTTAQEIMDSLQQVRIPRLKKARTLAEQYFSNVEVTEGEDPISVFNALHGRKTEGSRHVGRA